MLYREDRESREGRAEQASKQFYAAFMRQHATLQAFLSGMSLVRERDAYVSLLLKRLMFVYFIQAQGLLNNHTDYLRERLAWSQAHLGVDRYYREFLCVLFFEGFAREVAQRSVATNQKLGAIPYLSGDLFAPHALEDRYGAVLDLPDHAFAHLFDFFSGWHWHLNAASGAYTKAIDPAMLGYICEKQINQKQKGVYYTRDDITGYICRTTIIPALCDKAGLALTPLNLPATISAYIYPVMRQEYPLPSETPRELVARRARVATLVAAAQAGNLATINDAVTANLDLEAMLADLIPHLDAPKLYALYAALAGDPQTGQLPLSILDPTVGSGAFLLAALRILKPIYAAVLGRIDELMATHAEQLTPRRKGAKEEASDPKALAPARPCLKKLREVLDAAAAHPNRAYFITKRIVERNLYGVDLMDEATTIGKLRLFLGMVADLDDAGQIEPLSAIGFNLHTGNALVGCVHPDERGLAAEASNAQLDAALLKSGQLQRMPDGGYNTQPLHWCSAFGPIIAAGGFDVIVGNPPYVEYRKVKQSYRVAGYQTETSGNLYAFVIERALKVLAEGGRLGMIVPIASVSTTAMQPLQRLYQPYIQWHSHYAVRPGKLFAGVDMNLTITLLQQTSAQATISSTSYQRWFSGKQSERPFLFAKLVYHPWEGIPNHANPLPKIGSAIEARILKKMHAHGKKVRDFTTKSGTPIYYHSGGRYWRKALPEKLSSHYKPIYVPEHLRPVVLTLLNSQLFYWYWIIHSNCMDVVAREVMELPIFDLDRSAVHLFADLEEDLLIAYDTHQTKRARCGEMINITEINIDVKRAKPILDNIDRIVAVHYGLNEDELDFIINYDIKYRMRHAGE